MVRVEDGRRRGCFLQFAKAPRAGAVKTRLHRRLAPAAAADVARELTCRVAAALRAVPAGWDVVLCVDDTADVFLRELAAREGREMRAQGEGDLGARMWRAVDAALADYRAVIVVGSDCLGYDAAYLGQAVTALERGCDAVLGPALDGGYVLAGFTRLPPEVFADVQWSTGAVLAQQRERLAALGLRWEELPVRADIDRPEDLWRLGAGDQALAIGRLSP
jgi:uncharacterized protein